MRIVLVGAAGTLGTAVREALAARGHDVVTVGRSTGHLRFDIAEPEQVAAMYAAAGAVDAVVSTAGDVPFKPFDELSTSDYLAAVHGKVLSQVELVRQGRATVSPHGSFTLVTGILAREPIRTGAAASLANGAVEAFVRAAAVEIAPQRINSISPTVFTENLAEYDSYFPGWPSVPLSAVAQAYVRSVEGAQTGQVFVP